MDQDVERRAPVPRTDEERPAIGRFIKEICKRRRLHSALDYPPPTEF